MLELIGNLAWPVLIGVIVYYYRIEIKAALSRIKEFGPTGFKLGDAAATQQAIATTPHATTHEMVISIKQRTSEEQLAPNIQQIRKELDALSQNKDEQFELLIHAAASANIQLVHERIYRNIFGSQMNALVRMNNPGGASKDEVRQLYAEAAAQYPEPYKVLTFEEWIAFLVNSGLAVQANDRYQTTQYGGGFLKYIVDMHLITPKAY